MVGLPAAGTKSVAQDDAATLADRRRPGRIDSSNAELIEMLRNPAGAAGQALDGGDQFESNDNHPWPARGAGHGLVLSFACRLALGVAFLFAASMYRATIWGRKLVQGESLWPRQ